MIQLKLRTEYSFGETFAPVERVVARLQELGVTAAGCVDVAGSTWAHVKWQSKLRAAGITPMFGAEFVVVKDLEHPVGTPTSWVLAEDTRALYRLTTRAAAQAISGRPALTVQQFLDAPGLVKFAGSALAGNAEAVEAGVYLDFNPGAILAQVEAAATLRRVGAARAVLTSDNYYATPACRKLHELTSRVTKATPQHILTEAELRHMVVRNMTPAQVESALEHAQQIAARLGDVKLQRAPLIAFEGDVEALCREGAARRCARGQIAAWTDIYEARLQRELQLVRDKQFDSYFLVVADMVAWAKQRMLVGPARGSAAGSLMCYLMGITEVDPLPYGLMFERFVDITRADLPDIDLDFPDSKRDSVYDYLRGKYGAEYVARIGTVSEFKPKSALSAVAKKLGIPPWETNAVRDAMFVRSSGDSRANNCLMDTLNETTPGKSLIEKFPAIALAGEIEGHASHTGLHAAGVIVCNEPISDFCTVVGGVAMLDKPDAESLNLLKIDALGLRTLSVIEDAGVISNEEIYTLPLDDPAVFALLNSGKFSGIFQWEGQALQSITRQVHMATFEDMVHVTALARPGPLGGGAATRFILRHKREEAVSVAHKDMLPYLAESFGLVLYQEQVMRIVREIGQFTWEETTTIRKAMSGRMGNEYFERMGKKFIEGAKTTGLNAREAKDIWEQINSMGAWAFNKSHSVSYSLVSYWTAWLKAKHPLEFAASALRNAKNDETAFATLREIVAEGVEYVPFDLNRSEETWTVKDGVLIGGFMGLKGVGPTMARNMITARSEGKLTQKQKDKLAEAERIFGDLYPAHTQWRTFYEDPEKAGLRRGSRVINLAELPEAGEVVVIGRLKSKDPRDYNEAVRLARRGGKLMKGQTQFLDLRIMDDTSLTPYLCRIDRHDYEPVGRLLLERGREDHHWFLIRGEKLRNFPMIQVHKIRCLNDPNLFREEIAATAHG